MNALSARPLLKRTWVRIALVILALILAARWFFSSPPVPARKSGQQMDAIVYHKYGSPDVLRLEHIDKLLPNDSQVLIKVRAASANPLDWHFMHGTPYIMRIGTGFGKPKAIRLGADVSGVIELVGSAVTQFKPGDEVFGTGGGSYGQYVRTSFKDVVLKPASISFEQAAAIPVAGVTALQGLRDKGKIQKGQKVLINGASGGVGTFAVQIAKAMGAEVTGVCSTKNIELVKSLGADHVIDYTKDDYSKGAEHYDVILDNVGNHSLSENRHVLVKHGTYVLIGGGGPNDGKWVGPLLRPIAELFQRPFVSQRQTMLLAQINQADLNVLANLIETKKVTPVIDRTYPLSEVPAAIRYLEEGHAKGKVVITVRR